MVKRLPYARLLFHKVATGGLAPGMWLVVGPLGQSIAGAYALGSAATVIWPQFGRDFVTAAIVYGLFVWGFANYWLALSTIATLRAVRTGMPFTLRWWAFCFATGMLTAGTDALYAATGARLFAFVAAAQLALHCLAIPAFQNRRQSATPRRALVRGPAGAISQADCRREALAARARAADSDR
jgi:tellurite resistance protein TehA-like permease